MQSGQLDKEPRPDLDRHIHARGESETGVGKRVQHVADGLSFQAKDKREDNEGRL